MLFSLLTDCGVVLGVLTAALAIVRGAVALERELEERRDRRCKQYGRVGACHGRYHRADRASVRFPFCSQSGDALVEAIASAFSHAQISTLLLKAGADAWDPERFDNKEHRLQMVLKAMRAADTPEAEKAARALVCMTMEKIHPPPIGRAN
jgi:hypothetical protein